MRDEKSPFLVNRTKLHRPPLPSDLVSRPRLLTRLEGWRRLALTLVCAPAGYGKSTFIANWLATCDCPSAWISLDENDNDPRVLLTYILEAMQTIVPGACSGIRDVLKSDILPSSHILAATLGDNLDHIDKELILVLDDYHVVHEKAVHDVIAELLLHIPREVHLVLGTRHDPPFPLSSMRARHQLAEIRVQDLSFTRQETVEFLQNVLDIGVDSDLAVAFEDKSEGWAAGLRLMATTLRRRKDPRELLAGLEREHRHVVEFLVDQVLADQPANVQAFLLDTSILDRFCGPLCDALHPSSGAVQELDGEGFVAIAERANLFLIPLDEEFRWFRYHYLFRNLLRRRLKRRKSTGEIADLHARASVWLAGKGLIEDALHHALQSGAPEQAAILVNDHRQDLMNAEQWHRLRSWLHALPRNIIDGDPGLLMLEAWTWLGFPEMAGFVEKSGKLLAEMPDSTPHKQSLQGELNTLRSLVHFHVADGERAVAFAQSALEELPVDRASIRAMAVIVLSMGYQMIGHLERAHAVVHEALGSEEADRETYHSRVLATSCFVRYIAANLVHVRQSADRLLDLGRESGLPESTAHAHYFLGLCHYDRNELDDAEKHIAAVVKAPYVVNVHNHSYSAFVLALTYEAIGRSNDAREVVDAVADLAMTARNASLVQIAQAFQAELAIRQGRIAEAVQWASTFDPHPFFVAYRFYMPQLTLAKVLIAQDTAGTREKAARLLSESNDFFSGIHNMRLVIEIVALQALLYDAGGDESAALSALDCAVSAAEPGGFVRLFLDLGPRMAGLLDRLVRRNKKAGLAGRILAAFRDERSAEMGAAQALAGDLSRREREILSLIAGRLSNREIATQLIISQETVKRHAANIYQKLHVNSRQEAVARARTLGYLPRK